MKGYGVAGLNITADKVAKVDIVDTGAAVNKMARAAVVVGGEVAHLTVKAAKAEITTAVPVETVTVVEAQNVTLDKAVGTLTVATTVATTTETPFLVKGTGAIAKVEAKAPVEIAAEAKVESVTAEASVTLKASVAKVTVPATATDVTVSVGTGATLATLDTKTNVIVAGEGNVTTVAVESGAGAEATVTVNGGATVDTVMNTGGGTVDVVGNTTGTKPGNDDVVKLESITVTSDNHKTEYQLGEALDVTNLKIKATYTGEGGIKENIPVTQDMVTFSSSAAGENIDVRVTYFGKETTYKITVAAADKTALSGKVLAATNNKGTADVSPDGKDIAPGTDWVTQAVMTAYADAIAAADKVAKDATATVQQVKAAVTAGS